MSGNHNGPYYLYSNGQVTPLAYPSDAANEAALPLPASWGTNGSNSMMTLPGYQYTHANAINAQGQVVGSSYNPINNTTSAGFVYSNGVMTNLNSLISSNTGLTILAGLEINNLGQILALSYNPSAGPYSSGEGFVLLTPSDLPAPGEPDYPTIIPEPTTLGMFGLMAVGLAFRFRRRRGRPAQPRRRSPGVPAARPAFSAMYAPWPQRR